MRSAVIIFVLFFSLGSEVVAEDFIPKDIVVYKNPECTCCKKWIKYLEEHDYKVTAINTLDVLSEKKRLGVPPKIKAGRRVACDSNQVMIIMNTFDE